MRRQVWRQFLGWVVLGWCMTGGALWAAEYQLRIVNVEEKLFFRYVDTQGAFFQAERHVLPQLNADLDNATLSPSALLPDRHTQPVPPGKDRSGQLEAVTARVIPPQHSNLWLVAQWQGTAGKIAVFQISSQLVHYQELVEVAVDTDGVLRRLPVSGVPLFGPKKMLAPEFAATYISYRFETGMFVTKIIPYAASFDGLSIIVGRNHNLYFPDYVYVVVQMPPEAKTYKVVLAWKDRETLRDGDGKNGGAINN